MPYKGSLANVIQQLMGGLRAAWATAAARRSTSCARARSSSRSPSAGMRESHVHDVQIVKEAPNYRSNSMSRTDSRTRTLTCRIALEDPDPRFRRAVHAADRAPGARDERLLRDPSVRRRRRVRARVRRARHHPVGRPRERHAAARRRARRTPCSSSACRCSASATACRRWPRSSAARSKPGRVREFGYAEVRARGHSALFRDIEDRRNAEGHGLLDVWMSHGDKVIELPPGFKLIAARPTRARSRRWPTSRARFYGVQFHPEVTHTPQGAAILARFVHEICGCGHDWNMPDYVGEAVAPIRAQVGDDEVMLGLSGGVDSSVAAALIHRAIGDQLTCVFVDHGLLRLNEAEQVMDTFATHLGVQRDPRRRGRRVPRGARGRRRSRSRSARSSAGCSSTCSSARRRSSPASSGSRRARSIRT